MTGTGPVWQCRSMCHRMGGNARNGTSTGLGLGFGLGLGLGAGVAEA